MLRFVKLGSRSGPQLLGEDVGWEMEMGHSLSDAFKMAFHPVRSTSETPVILFQYLVFRLVTFCPRRRGEAYRRACLVIEGMVTSLLCAVRSMSDTE